MSRGKFASAGPKSANNIRRRLYVDPAFQKRLLWRVLLYWVFYHGTVWHLMFLLNFVGVGIKQDPTAPSKSFWALYGEFTMDHLWVIVCFLVMLPVLGRDLLKFSHRIAGPLVRFRNTLQAIADGKPVTTIKLRDKDFLTDFLLVFNRMVESWNSRLKQQELKRSNESELELAATR